MAEFSGIRSVYSEETEVFQDVFTDLPDFEETQTVGNIFFSGKQKILFCGLRGAVVFILAAVNE